MDLFKTMLEAPGLPACALFVMILSNSKAQLVLRKGIYVGRGGDVAL